MGAAVSDRSLFDRIAAPKHLQSVFTPQSHHWTERQYHELIENLLYLKEELDAVKERLEALEARRS